MSAAGYEERLKSTGRNDTCPCGSGKKYKKCHLAEDETARSAVLKAKEEEAKARAAEEAEADAEADGEKGGTDKSAGKTGKHGEPRAKAKPGAQAQGTDAKPKNIPRRGAI